jgi:hypothetical protein
MELGALQVLLLLQQNPEPARENAPLFLTADLYKPKALRG